MKEFVVFIHPEMPLVQAQSLALERLNKTLSKRVKGRYESTLPKHLYPQGDFTEADESRPVVGFFAGVWSESREKWVNETSVALVRHPWAPKGEVGWNLKMPRNRKKNFKKGN